MYSTRLRWRAAPAALVLLAAACGGFSDADPKGDPDAPLVSVRVDPGLSPRARELPGFDVDRPRPLAATAGVDGEAAVFVANELWVSTDDRGALDELLGRWDGEVVATLDPDELDLDEVPAQYLVRVDASAADVAKLGEHIRELDENVTGDYAVSSEQGRSLLAAAAEEAASGRAVGLNWVGEGAGFRDRELSEAPTGAPSGYDPNPFTWPSHSIGSAQDIGVAEAWRALDFAGRLDERVDLAVLDMGFVPDADLPADWTAISNVPTVDPTGTDNILHCGNPCPWHGTNVASASMAVPDNGFGSAGPGGPVARPILVFTLYDFFTSMTALGEAKALGAKIANMSYEAPIPDYVSWSAAPFNTATAGFRRSGMLLFAAAGNDGRDVNAERCVGAFGVEACWERRFHVPCQSSGVICVGGLGDDSPARHADSNFGASVDLFAPFVQWLGPDPDAPANEVQEKAGTSMSSPFVAGIAALVWAADPSASADDVERHLRETARPSDFVEVSRTVDAYGAVLAALGNVPPAVTITNPDDGGEADLHRAAGLRATAVDVEDGEDCCTVDWSSDVDGFLGTTEGPAHNLSHVFDTLGTRTVTAEVTDSEGEVSQDTVTFEVVNTPPTVEIARPEDGEEISRDVETLLRGTSRDTNEPGLSLECDAMSWTSSVASDPFPVTGCDALVTFPDKGSRVLSLTGTDPDGASGSASVTIEVVDPPTIPPPTVRILEPPAGALPYGLREEIDFEGTATDSSGTTALDYEWFVRYESDSGPARQLIGTTTTFSWAPIEVLGSDHCGAAGLTIELEVTNPDGAVGTDSVDVDVLHLC